MTMREQMIDALLPSVWDYSPATAERALDAMLDVLMVPTDAVLKTGGAVREWSGAVLGCEHEEVLKVLQAVAQAIKAGE